MKTGLICGVMSALLIPATCWASPVETVLLADFDSVLPSPLVAKATGANSSIDAGADSFSAVVVASEGGSNRLKITDAGGFRNGAVLTIPGALPEAGHYLVTADFKVDSTAAAPINTYGMAAKVGAADSTKVSDGNGAYVLNLPSNPTNGGVLGYQTIGVSVQVAVGGTFPKDLTLYFSTDPSGQPGIASSGDFAGSHRGSGASFPTASNTTAIYVDNIKRIGPGRFGEERHAWISLGDNFTNLATLDSYITQAHDNGFNCIDILVRYRANHYYIPHRDFNTFTNNEPYAGGASASNDAIQYAIDRGHELGMRVYGSFSTFLVTDGSNSYPAVLPSGSVTYVYNSGSPRAQTTADDGSGLWADPGRADVRAYTLNIVKDLVENYDLDGIIFDRMRYQGTSFGYNPQARVDMGFGSTVPSPTAANWIGARQLAITTFLHDAYVAITDMKPWMVVGTVPVAYLTSMNDTYNRVFQSWPDWSAMPTANRVVKFGAEDLIQPQFYRMWDTSSPYTAPAGNETLMTKALYGDTASDSMDFGLMPGANTNIAPLFYAEDISDTTDAANTAAALATNICDTQTASYFMNGSGIYSAEPTFNAIAGASVVSRIHSASTPCGSDVLAPAVPPADFLMKAGYDNTPPNGVTGTALNNLGYSVQLDWAVPSPAEDGELPTRYLIYRSTSATVKPYYANLVNKAAVVTGNSFTDAGFQSGGAYYYRVVAVDDYNNKATSEVVGPVTVNSATTVLESRLSNGSLNTSTYSESPAMSNTSSKSSAPGLSGSTAQGSRFRESLPASATYTPNLPLAGNYNVYVTVGGGSNTNNLAKANYTISNAGSPVTGQVNLYYNDATVGNAWKLLASDVPFAAGSGGSINFVNVDGDGAGPLAGIRFVMDAVKFEFAGSAVSDWALY